MFRWLAIAMMPAILSGCGMPGRTIADLQLQRDVWEMIILIEHADRLWYPKPVVDTRVDSVSADAGEWQETWFVERGKMIIEYPIHFGPAPQGGTIFSMRVPKREKPAP